MAYELKKLDIAKKNSISRYRLIDAPESINVLFTYRTFREVMEGLALSSGRIGYVLKLLNKTYPYEQTISKVSIDDKYPDRVFKDYAENYGFKVFRKATFSLSDALRVLKQRGYEIFPEVPVDVNNVVSIFKKRA
jgi:hypothetical protein